MSFWSWILGIFRDNRAKFIQKFLPQATVVVLDVARIFAGAKANTPEEKLAVDTAKAQLVALLVDDAKFVGQETFLDADGNVRDDIIDHLPIPDLKVWLATAKMGIELTHLGETGGTLGLVRSLITFAFEHVHE